MSSFNMGSFSEPILIAHACGAIDSLTYTNSVEALELAIANGYKYVEIDILESADGVLFGGHDWEFFNQITSGKRTPEILTANKIKNLKIYDKYTPLMADKINEIFTKNPELVLVTDKIRNYSAIVDQLNFPNREERLIVEVFTIKDYFFALKKNIKYPAYCVGSDYEYLAFLRKSFNFAMNFTIWIEAAEKQFDNSYNWGHTLAFSSNSKEQILRMFKKGQATMIYTDFITPKMLKEM